MDTTISELKNEFVKIIDQIGKIQTIKMSAHLKISRFKTIYDEMIHLNSAKKHFLVCLEALHFQYKMFVAEQESLTKTMALLVNRVYRDYYHYYNAIVKELAKYEISQPVVEKQHLVYTLDDLKRAVVSDGVASRSVFNHQGSGTSEDLKSSLVYKDTEPSAEFQAEDIALVFDNIVVLLNSISLKYNENEMVIQQYKTRSTTGIFIGNLINTLEYDNSVLDDHAKLFFKSVEFTIRTQSAYFAKLLKRFQSSVEDIDGEVSFHESSWDNSSLSVSDQLVQTTDDGNPRLSQWTGTKDDNGAKEEEESCVVGMTIDEIYKNNA